jgi:CBS domain containing-hemolysin-like protein
MAGDFWKWAGLAALFAAAFFLSLLHAALSSFSKISLSRFLENRKKEDRHDILDRYDETRIAVESLRVVFIIAFLIDFSTLLPHGRYWPWWFFLASLILFFIFYDYLPRLVAFFRKKRVVGIFLSSFALLRRLAAPLITLLRKLEERPIEEEMREASEEELDTFIDEATEEGIIEEQEGDLLKSVVEFGDTLVKEIMTPRRNMVCIRREATFGALRELILAEKYSRFPVYRDRVDNIEGLVIAKDWIAYSGDEHKDQPIDPIIRPAYFVPESMRVSWLLKELQRQKQKLAIVVDEHGGVAGLVSLEDLVEEIVGEIQDEYDQEEVPITEIGPQEFAISGEVNVDDVEKRLGRELAEDNFITVSGLITHHLGRLPKRGEKLAIRGLAFEILDVDQKRIKKVKVRQERSEESSAGDDEEG